MVYGVRGLEAGPASCGVHDGHSTVYIITYLACMAEELGDEAWNK
jgi:hypothetical protein